MPEVVQPEGRDADELRRVRSRPAVIAPARRAAFDVVLRVFEEDAYADRALDERGRRARRPRPRARATARVRHGAAHAHARLRDRAAREAAGAQARPAGARLAAPRRVPARVHRPGRARGRRRRRRARPRSAAASARCRSRTPSCAGSRRASAGSSRRCPRGRSRSRIPTGSPRRGRATSATRPRSSLMRAQNEPPALEVRADEPVGEPTDVPGAYVVERVDTDAHAADEPRVAARSARRRLAGRRADPRRLRGARRQDDDAARRGDRGRDPSRPRAALAKNVGPNVRVVNADLRELDEQRLRPRARRRAVLRPRRARPPPRPALARAAAARAPARAAARPRRSGRSRAGRSSTRSAR